MSSAKTAAIAALKKGDANAFHALFADGADAPDLNGETFEGLSLAGFDFSGLDLGQTEFSNCILSNVRFENAQLEGAYFDGTTCMGCTFDGADMNGAAIDGGVWKGCRLREADLSDSEFTGVEFEECVIEQNAMDDVTWESVTITGGELGPQRSLSGSWTTVLVRDADVRGFAPGELELTRCTCSAGIDLPGFGELSGRRTRIE